MITDDELTTELTRALRGGTDHLTYTGGVPRAHRPIAVTIAPLAATAAAATVLGWTALTAGGAPSGSAPEAAPTSTSPTSTEQARPEVVTDEIELAGVTFTYTRGADDPAVGPLFWGMREQVPAGAAQFDVDGTTVWAAEDPDTGFAALYLPADDGRVVALLSKTRTLDELRELAGTLRLG